MRNRLELLKIKAVDETMAWDLAVKEVFELFTGYSRSYSFPAGLISAMVEKPGLFHTSYVNRAA